MGGLSEVVRSPIYATGVGLILFGRKYRKAQDDERYVQPGMKNILHKMKSWFQGNF